MNYSGIRYLPAALVFVFWAIETRGWTIEQIDFSLTTVSQSMAVRAKANV